MSPDLSALNISTLTLLGLVILSAFYLGRLAGQIRLPALIGYMAAGLVLGPSLLNVFTEDLVEQLSFLAEIGLGFVALTIGSELSISSLKRLGLGIICIIFAESLLAFLFVALSLYMLSGDLALSIIFGSMACASAPAGTVAVIQEVKAHGKLTKALYAVVGFDDGLAVIIYGFAACWAKCILMAESGNGSLGILSRIGEPFMEIGLSITMGAITGFIFCRLIRRLQNPAEILVITFATVLISCGLAIRFHLSLILVNMVVGFILANLSGESLVQKIRKPLQSIMPLIFILFFSLAGAHLKIWLLPLIGSTGLVYIVARSLGLISGAWLGAVLGGIGGKIKKYLGLGILSQAGVAIGLALITKHDLSRIAVEQNLPHAEAIGTTVLTTIAATSVFFEIIGPICTRFALKKSGEVRENS